MDSDLLSTRGVYKFWIRFDTALNHLLIMRPVIMLPRALLEPRPTALKASWGHGPIRLLRGAGL